MSRKQPLRFCAPEIFCLPQGITPVMGSGADSPCQGEMARRARGGRVGDYEHEVLIRSRPRWRFGSFAAMGKVTRRPQAAKSPCKKRNCSIIAPSSVWPDGQPPSPQGEGLGKTKRDRFLTCPLKHRGETQFRRKFLCLLSFSKKVRGPGSPPGPLTCVCCKGEGEMGEFFVILGTVISYRRNTSKS